MMDSKTWSDESPLYVSLCKTYDLNPKKALTTLSYIEQEGVFNLIQYNKQRATVKFLLNQNQILDLLKDQSETSKVIQAIIRNHHDVYTFLLFLIAWLNL